MINSVFEAKNQVELAEMLARDEERFCDSVRVEAQLTTVGGADDVSELPFPENLASDLASCTLTTSELA